MRQLLDFGPVELRYAAALRGIVPVSPETAFIYARYGKIVPEAALCLAASNPEGQFYFLMPDAVQAASAQERAQILRLNNCRFVVPTATDLPAMDFFCADLGETYEPTELQKAQEMAGRFLAAGGLFACRYAPFSVKQDGLHYMVAEFAPELQPAQHVEFLHELKQLGQYYFSRHPEAAAALDNALGQQNPQLFLDHHGAGHSPLSVTVQMIAGLVPAGFSFVGDAEIQANYLELMVPKQAQEVLFALRGHLLYESIKDFATARATRTDIWVKQPAQMTGDLATLFGHCYFGLPDGLRMIGDTVRVNGQTLDLKPLIFQKLLGVMQLLPLTVGDFLSHPDGAGFTSQDVVMAMHALVAFGLAVPMRGSFGGLGQVDYQYPQLAGQYNQQLRATQVKDGTVLLASTVAGRPLQFSLAEALVLQAVGRVGLAESADALMPELHRVAGDPDLSASIFTAQDATPANDFAETMIRDICSTHMVGWYALGVLDAA